MSIVATLPKILVGPNRYIVIKSVKGPSSYPTGGFEITIPELMRVDEAIIMADSGYKAEVVSKSGNTIKVLVRGKTVNIVHAACGATGAAYPSATTLATVRDLGSEVDNGTNLSGVNFLIIAVGVA